MRIRHFMFVLAATGAAAASAHEQVYAHTHESELLSGFAEMLFAAPPWAYVIGAIAVAVLLRALWKTS